MNPERYSDKTITFYPFKRYKNHNFRNAQKMKEDVAKRLQDIQEFDSTESDVILATFMKSGTHWVHEIVSMLLSQQTEYYKSDNIRDMNLEIGCELEKAYQLPSPRLLHTHMPFQYLPRKHTENGYKIIYLNRNPKDRHVSMYLFMQGKRGVPDWTWADYFDRFVVDNGDLYGGWFSDTKEWLDAKKKYPDSILSLHYEQLIKEPIETVANLAKFLNVPNTEEFIREIVDKCSFEKLKNNKIDATRCLHPEGKSTIFREGKIGGWKNWFTVSQNDRFDELYQKEMAGYDVKFTYTN